MLIHLWACFLIVSATGQTRPDICRGIPTTEGYRQVTGGELHKLLKNTSFKIGKRATIENNFDAERVHSLDNLGPRIEYVQLEQDRYCLATKTISSCREIFVSSSGNYIMKKTFGSVCAISEIRIAKLH